MTRSRGERTDRRWTWLRIVLLAVIGSIVLTAGLNWGTRGYVEQRRSVRDQQYQQTQRELAEQRARIAELERRLKVSPSVAP